MADDNDDFSFDLGSLVGSHVADDDESDDDAGVSGGGNNKGRRGSAAKAKAAKGKAEEAKAQSRRKDGTCGTRKGSRPSAAAAAATAARESLAREALLQSKSCVGFCKKKLPISSFNEDQNVCKECYNARRKFKRLLVLQNEEEWFDQLQAENPKEAEKTMKTFAKHCKTHGPKVRFSLLEHKRRLLKKSGVRGSRRRKWMWEKEFLEEMEKTTHGNLTAEEAKLRWKQMLAAGVKRDNKGPRGTTRMKVTLGDYDSSFDEVGDEEEYEARDTPRKKATEEDYQKAGNALLNEGSRSMFLRGGGNSSASTESDDEEGGTRGRLRSTFEAQIDGRSLTTSSAFASVRTFQTGARATTPKKARGGVVVEDTDDEEDDRRALAVSKEPQEGGDQEDEWFDKDTILPKASRKLTTSAHKSKTDLMIQVQLADAALMEFSALGDEGQSSCRTERDVLEFRLNAARLVLAEGELSTESKNNMEVFIRSFGRSSVSEASSVSPVMPLPPRKCSSGNLRCGPCLGFQNLVPFPFILDQATKLKDTISEDNSRFTTKKSLDEYIDSFEPALKATAELCKSLKAACEQMYQAKLDHQNLATNAETTLKKAAQKRRAVAAAAEALEAKKSRLPRQDRWNSNALILN